MAGFALFVNTCDAYEDCWDPFFVLLKRYWHGPLPRVFLNTEDKIYSHQGVEIVCTRVGRSRHGRGLPWGEQLRRGLGQVPDEIVLYMHEDFFLQAPTDQETIGRCVDVINADASVAGIRLHELGGAGPWSPCEHAFLWEVDRRSPYRISLQAGLWRKERLRRFVRPHETPWQFEIWGSMRLRWRRDRILCVNRDIYLPETRPVLPYPCDDTVKKGKWNGGVVCDLFAANGIDVDFERRGFLKPEMPTPKGPVAQRALARVRSLL